MHSALLPVHESFTPRGHASRAPGSFLRRTRSSLRHQGATLVLRRALYVLAVLFVLVHVAVVPWRQRRALGAAGYGGAGYGGAGNDAASVLSALSAANVPNAPGVYTYDFAKQSASSERAAERGERVLICMPLRNAEPVLELMFGHLRNLSYPHRLIDIAFLVSDSEDTTYDTLISEFQKIQTGRTGWQPSEIFNNIDIYKHDFGARIGQGVDARHGVAVQAERRKLMGRARNWLLSLALKPEHSWVYWRDADIERSEPSIIQDLMRHDKDVIVPNVWRPLPTWLGGQQPYDLNSWQESDAAVELAQRLDEDDVIVEGYAEYPTWRVHLAYLRNDEGTGNIDEIIDLDGVGGVSILARAKVFRAGANFPGFAFMSHAETEGFGKMCRRMDFSVAGLTQYTVWHKYEPSDEDLEKMKEREAMGLSND